MLKRTVTRTRTILAACGVTVLLLGGCNGGDDEAASTTSAPAPGPTTTGRPVDTSFTGQDSARFCDLARTYDDRSTALGSSPTPGQLRTAVQEGEAAISQAVGAAPPEIKNDVEVLAAAFGAVVDELEKANFDPNRVSPAAFEQLQAPEFQAATTRFQAYLRNVCGVAP